jgi:hypothetical protein
MDYMAGLPSTKKGNDYVFLVVFWFLKMVILTSYKKSITMTNTAKIFFKHVWVHFGIPQNIISDWDNRFLNTFWSRLWSLLETKLTKSAAFHPQTDGQKEVTNHIIVHILHMHNSKNMRITLHSSTDHNLFQVGLGLFPMFILRPTKPLDSLSGFKKSANKSMIFYRKPMLSTSSAMINIGYRTSCRWEIRSHYICIKSTL